MSATVRFSVGCVAIALGAACASSRGAAGTKTDDAAATAEVPATILIRGEWLAESKRQLAAGDRALRPALDALLDSAKAALRSRPIPVTEKRRTPPSGDKHDYMSLAPYWWPDPGKPDGLPYIRRDGEVNPQSRVDHDGAKLGRTIADVETLALAWYFTGDPRFSQRAASDLRVFFLDSATRMNPNLKYAQAVLGVNDGRGTGIIDTENLPRLLDAIRLLRGAPGWSASDDAAMTAWCRAYLTWLIESPNGRDERAAANNHGNFYDEQVVGLALFVGDTALARTVAASATARIDSQIKPDGAQPLELARTRSLHYSVFSLVALSMTAEMARHVGVDLWNYSAPSGGSIVKAMLYVAPYADPKKPWPRTQLTPAGHDVYLSFFRRAASALDGPAADSAAAALRFLPAPLRATSRLRLAYPEVP